MDQIFTFAVLFSAALVVTSTSTVFSVLWLVATFILVSILLGLLNLGTVSLLYIIVYVGAIAILFLFVIQLLDLGDKDSNSTLISTNIPQRTTSYIVIGLIMVAASPTIVPYFFDNTLSLFELPNLNVFSLSQYNLNINDTIFNSAAAQVKALAEWLYGPGLIALITISLILLIAMIAPISLCKDQPID